MTVPSPSADAGPVEPVLVPPRGLVAFILLALLATAVAGVLLPGELAAVGKPSLRLANWQPEGQEIERIGSRREALLAAQVGDQAKRATEQVMLDAMRAYMGSEKARGVEAMSGDAQARVALGRLEEQVREHALAHGGDALRAMAVRYARDVRVALDRTLSQLHGAGSSFAAAARGGAAHPALTTLEQVAPGSGAIFLHMGVDELFDGAHLSPAAALLVEALAEQRVLQLGQRLTPVPSLASDLRRMVDRYRVEAHGGLALKRRLQLLDELALNDASYPATYVTAVLLARAGRYRAARATFRQAASVGEFPRLARANARWCRSQMARTEALKASP